MLIELQLRFVLLRSVRLRLAFLDVGDLLDELGCCDCVEVAEVPEANGAFVEGIRVEAGVFV